MLFKVFFGSFGSFESFVKTSGLRRAMAALVACVVILLFNLYVLGLFWQGQLDFYIHPRYDKFTVALNLLSVVLSTIGILLAAWRVAFLSALSARDSSKQEEGRLEESAEPSGRRTTTLATAVAGLRETLKGRGGNLLVVVPTLAILLVAYLLPVQALSQQTVEQRSNNFNGAATSASTTQSYDTAAASQGGSSNAVMQEMFPTKTLSMEDWRYATEMGGSSEFYATKSVDLTGFVFVPEGAPKYIFYVTRFRMTCCAVDAQPIGVPVRYPGWQERFERNEWVNVRGAFRKATERDGAGKEGVVAIPTNVRSVAPSEDPYL